MTRKFEFRPSLMTLEARWLPTVSAYPDVVRNALQASFVAQADTKANDLVFLGDSITDFWEHSSEDPSQATPAWSADFEKLGAADFGIIGDTSQNLLDRIDGGDLNGQPKVVVLMIGVNDLLAGDSAGQTASNITSVVQAIHTASPDSKVLLLGLLPTDVSYLNANIPAVNQLISGLAATESYVTYLNPGVAFEQPGGAAQPGLLRDVVHPDDAGYQLLAGEIDPTILDLLGEGASVPPSTTTSTTTKVTGTTKTTTQPQSQAVDTTATPDVTLIPVVIGTNTPAQAPTDPLGSTAHAKSFATELIDAPSN